jgi:outer membrane protein assembly factor BamB
MKTKATWTVSFVCPMIHAASARAILASALYFALLVGSSAIATENTFFRAGGGVAADEQALPEHVDSPGLLRWKQPLASGHSTPCICGERIFVTTFEDGTLATEALDRNSGKSLWRQVAPAKEIEKFHQTSSPATSTPACDGERVYVFFGSYGLLCYDFGGKLVWQKPLGPFQDEFGSASSPVLCDGKLLLNEDHDKDSYLLALDAKTGQELWKTPRDGFTRSYSTPVIFESAGKKQVVVAGALQLAGYDLDDGQQLWTMSGLARIVNTTPVVAGGMLYVATWSPGGDTDARVAMEPWKTAVEQWDKNGDKRLAREEVNNPEVLDRFYRIDLNQDLGLDEAEWNKYARVFELARNSIMSIRLEQIDGKWQTKVVWDYAKGIPYVPSPLVYDGVVYLVKEGIFTSFDAATGKVLKLGRLRGTGGYYGSPIAGDGKIYAVSERGVLNVVKAAGAWEMLSSYNLDERTMATPVIDDGRVYVRTEKHLFCFGKD